jgi:hypothetical protein
MFSYGDPQTRENEVATILITGCRRPTGFERLSAITLAKKGHTVYATMRDAAQGKALLEEAARQSLDISFEISRN